MFESLQQYQKEAIWRQMQEYKREKNTLEALLNEMTKRSTYHDDHLRIIDAWWKQVSVFVALTRFKWRVYSIDGLLL